MSSTPAADLIDKHNAARKRIAELEAENQQLKKRLTQNPRDARCQLYKLVQKYNHEAESCNSLCDRLKDENQRLRDALESIESRRDMIPATNDNIVWGYLQTIVDIAKQALEKET